MPLEQFAEGIRVAIYVQAKQLSIGTRLVTRTRVPRFGCGAGLRQRVATGGLIVFRRSSPCRWPRGAAARPFWRCSARKRSVRMHVLSPPALTLARLG